MRSATDVKIAGVCAGLAEYMGTDPTVIRLFSAVLALVSGIFPGIIAYLLGWIIMPVAPLPAPAPVPQSAASQSAQTA